jgi:hypothetical protein
VRGAAVDADAANWLQQHTAPVLNAGDFVRRETVVAKITALLRALPKEATVGSGARESGERSLLQLVSERLLNEAVRRGLSDAAESVRALVLRPNTKPAEQQPKQSALGNLAAVLAEAGLSNATSEEVMRQGLKQTLSGTAQEVERLRDRAAAISVQSSALKDFRRLLETIQSQLKTPVSEGDRALQELIKKLDSALAGFEQQMPSDAETDIRHTLRGALEDLSNLVKSGGAVQDAGDSALSPPFMRAARQLQAMLQLLTELPDEALLEHPQLFGKGALSLVNLKAQVATAADRELFVAMREFERRIADASDKPQAIRAEARGLLDTVTRVLDGNKSTAAMGGGAARSQVLGVGLQDAIGRLLEGRVLSAVTSEREGGAGAQSAVRAGQEGSFSSLRISGAEAEGIGVDEFVSPATAIREYQRAGIQQVGMEGRNSLQALLRELIRDPQSGQIIKLLARLSGAELLNLSESERALVTELQRLVGPLRAEVEEVAQQSTIPKAELKKILSELKDALGLQRAADAISKRDSATRLSLDKVRGILEGQVVLNQMAPAMQLKGEAMAILLPSFLGGMFGTVQIKKSTDDDKNPAGIDQYPLLDEEDSGSEPYKRLQVALTLPTLGPVEVHLVYRARELAAQLVIFKPQAAAWIDARIGALEGTIRSMGYQKISLQVVQGAEDPTLEEARDLGPYSGIQVRKQHMAGSFGAQSRGAV